MRTLQTALAATGSVPAFPPDHPLARLRVLDIPASSPAHYPMASADDHQPHFAPRPDRIIITIDGPAGTGKSTMARLLAARLELEFLDTGAMYRAVTAIGIDCGIDLTDGETLAREVERLHLRFDWKTDPPRLLIDWTEMVEASPDRSPSGAATPGGADDDRDPAAADGDDDHDHHHPAERCLPPSMAATEGAKPGDRLNDQGDRERRGQRTVAGLTAETPSGRDINVRIRDTDVTEHVSTVAGQVKIRALLVRMQRAIAARHPRLVTEGRDQGSVVFPDATVKFYLDATPVVRARRRYHQLVESGQDASLEAILESILRRDELDRSRLDGPLIVPDDAIIIDTTDLTHAQVVEVLLDHVKARTGIVPRPRAH